MPQLKERKLASTTAPPKAGAGGAGEAAEGGPGKKKKRPPLLVVIAAVVLLLGLGAGGYWWFGMRTPPPPPPPEPGEVAAFEPLSLNLADGHYLKVGIALQMVAAEGGGHGKKEVVDGSKAKDAAIEIFSGRTMAELSDPAVRETLKEELFHRVDEAYHHEVLDVYFTEFVMQ
jgi:flagellar protein FliL